MSLGTVFPALGATPYREATVTRTQNKVSYGMVKGDRSELRPAAVDDVVRASNFLQTETDSRAELKYEDGSLVRIGQSTIFSFEAITRTLLLNKGSMIFYVPKGSGGANIKTPSLTAAITGTVGKVSSNYIVIIEGSIMLKPSGRVVNAGQFARFEENGSISIDFYDQSQVLEGKLMNFNGPLPVLSDKVFARSGGESTPLGQTSFGSLGSGWPWKPDFSAFDGVNRAGNLPGAQEKFSREVAGPTPVKKADDPPIIPPPSTPSSPQPGPPIQRPF